MSGVNVMGSWTRYGSFALGMALDATAHGKPGASSWVTREQDADERRYPDNQFVQNAREADWLADLYWWGVAMPVHDRPEPFVRMSGCCGRPDNGIVQPHALWALAGAER